MIVRRAERQVSIKALPGVRATAAETEASAGVGVERARGQLGVAEQEAKARGADAAAGFFDRASQIGAAVYGDLVKRERQKADETALLSASNALSDWKNKRIYDPESGILTVRGRDAMPLPEQVRGEFQKIADDIEGKLTTPEQKMAFARLRSQEWQGVDLQVRRHVFGEIEKYRTEELKSHVDNSVNAAIANAADPKLVSVELSKATAAITQNGPTLGMGPEAVEAQVRAVTSKVHVGVIANLLSTDNDRAASVYFETVKGQIAGEQLDQVQRMIDVATTAGTGLRAAEAIWQQHGPKSDADPIALDQMEDAARERFRDDPKVLDATVKYLRERRAAVDAGRKDREDAIAGSLWRDASQGASLAQIQHSSAYLAAPGRVQAQITDYIVNRAEHEASRAYAEEGREYTRTQRVEAERTQAGWAGYWFYNQPDTLARMSENQILGLMPVLGTEHVNRLIANKRDYAASPEKVREATIDQELFGTLAESAGLHPYKPQMREAEKATLGQLRNTVESAIDAEQRSRKRTLTRDEKRTVMQQIIDRRVMIDRWGSDVSLPAAVVNSSDRENAYVPMEQIRETSLNQWVNVIRSTVPREQRSTRADILSRWRDRIQKAHAAAVLGLGAEEELRRLQGR